MVAVATVERSLNAHSRRRGFRFFSARAYIIVGILRWNGRTVSNSVFEFVQVSSCWKSQPSSRKLRDRSASIVRFLSYRFAAAVLSLDSGFLRVYDKHKYIDFHRIERYCCIICSSLRFFKDETTFHLIIVVSVHRFRKFLFRTWISSITEEPAPEYQKIHPLNG